MRFTEGDIGKRAILDIDPRGLEVLAGSGPSMELVGDIKSVTDQGVLMVHGGEAKRMTYIPYAKIRGHALYGRPDPTVPY